MWVVTIYTINIIKIVYELESGIYHVIKNFYYVVV